MAKYAKNSGFVESGAVDRKYIYMNYKHKSYTLSTSVWSHISEVQW